MSTTKWNTTNKIKYIWKNPNSGNDEYLSMGYLNNLHYTTSTVATGTGINKGLLLSAANSSNQLYLDISGNIGIGNTTPNTNYKLDVVGNISCRDLYMNDQSLIGNFKAITNLITTKQNAINAVSPLNLDSVSNLTIDLKSYVKKVI